MLTIRCPRRFFYTHILQTGGKRAVTAFMQMHECVRKLFKKVVKGELTSTGTHLREDVCQALTEEGLGEHGYFEHYTQFAVAMIEYFASTRRGYEAREPQALHVSYAGEEIVVTPDDVLVAADGRITLRRVSTGHSRGEDAKSISAAAFLAAAGEAFPGATVELVYLADRSSTALALKSKEMDTRRRNMESHLRTIRAGAFQAKPSAFSCPNCPALFICGPVPSGSLTFRRDAKQV
ncbi:PD-(D/E)XK nuclease family protein [Pulveribacter sp.]|uniref:PD-(D/E)XK nuclease family protein n=1 Tax=Pulveribacter sp. TaxID=2678893 RepID=UPI0028973A1E|nr:PD-(D/E)XK nuclease family protein [Pulveribacter sp.]